jgi:hypothetical protein
VTFTTHAHHLTDASAASLAGNVHFVRVSMDGVGHTYEALRGRDFEALRRRFGTISTLAPFGINFVVNARTLPDLDAATELAADVGAGQFLLLPEQPVRGKGGIDDYTMRALQCWVKRCRGTVPLAVSEVGAEDLPTCDPLTSESGLRAYAHVDASGVLKRTSFDSDGVVIGDMGVMEALSVLQSGQEEDMK